MSNAVDIYCPLKPTEKQRLFLDCDTKEVFFGGAAGGGKSVALLMAALKYVAKPGYAALIIRKDVPRLELPGGLIPLSHAWFSGNEKARWNAARRTWTFTTSEHYPPATITFGYLSRPLDKYRYASSEFQYIAFDELTDFCLEDYLFLFSRLRMTRVADVGLRMRSASNPGGIGRLWVKQRFIDGAEPVVKNSPLFMKEGRGYIPSRLDDNPHLHAEAYRDSLSHLPPVEREQLLSGDWDIQPDGVFQQEWLRYFVWTPATGGHPPQLDLLTRQEKSLATIVDLPASFDRFITIDPASTPEEEAHRATREPSWSVIQIWDQPKRHPQYLLLRDQVRKRLAINELLALIHEVAEGWDVKQIYIEKERLGTSVLQLFKHTVRVMTGIPTGNVEKKARTATLQNMMGEGRVFLPKGQNSWLHEFESELLHWTGHKRQPCDQIDAAAYAAIIADSKCSGPVKVQPAVVLG